MLTAYLLTGGCNLILKNKTIAHNKIICLLVCICICFCLITSPILTYKAQASVGAVTLITVGSVVAIGAILVGLGLVVTDVVEFEKLCIQIKEKVEYLGKLQQLSVLAVFKGISYVSQAAVELVASIANELKFFTAPASLKTFTTEQFGTGLVISDSLEQSQWNSFFDSSPKTLLFEKYDAPHYFKGYLLLKEHGSSYVYKENGALFSFGDGLHGGYYFTNNIFYYQWANGNLWPCYLYSKRLIGDTVSRSHSYISLSQYERLDFWPSDGTVVTAPPWGLTDKTPVITGGSISLPRDTPWSKNPAISIPGVANPSIPLTVPSDLPALKDVSQDIVQAGNPSSVVDKPIDKPITDETINKFKPSISLIDIFPFCIPFDVIKGFQLLNAPPTDPKWTWTIDIGYFEPWNFEINLMPYNGIFIFIRWFIQVLWCIGLAASTRKFIKW